MTYGFLFKFWRGLYRAHSDSGVHTLTGHVQVFPDNRIVEEIHHDTRLAAAKNPNKRLACDRIQESIVQSGVLERRGMPHGAALTKQVFVQEAPRTKKKSRRALHRCSAKTLPQA